MTQEIRHSYEIMTQKEARRSGKRFYYTGLPCREGHYALRYASSSNCLECRTFGHGKAGRESHRNIHWFNKPAIFSSGDYPDGLEWLKVQQRLLDLLPDVWESVKNENGPPTVPRDKIHPELRMRIIEGHTCIHMEKIDGRDYWWPMYVEAVKRDPRYAANTFEMFGSEHQMVGIFWHEGVTAWCVEAPGVPMPPVYFMRKS